MKKLLLGIVLLLAGVGGTGYCIYLLNSENFNQEKKNEQIAEDSSSQSGQCQRSLEKLKKLNSLQQKNNKKLLEKIEQLKKEKVAVDASAPEQKNEDPGLDSVKPTDEQKDKDDSETKHQDKKENSSEKNIDSKQKEKKKNKQAEQEEKNKRLNYIMVYYAKGKEDVSDQYESKIKNFANYFKDHRFRIGVRTGDSDNLVKNKKLARHRARKLRAVLKQAGIAAKDISYRIFPGNPVEKSDKPYTSSYWRRARIKAISKGDK